MMHDTNTPHSSLSDTEASEVNTEKESAAVQQTSSEKIQEELSQTKDQLLRALAETENVRRRAVRDREEASKYAMTQFARDILAIGDNLQRALAIVPENREALDPAFKQFLTGVEMTEREFSNILARFQIEKLTPLHQPFDPDLHQAMFEAETLDFPAGTVVQVMQVGYKIHDRLLRPALVGVARAPQGGAPTSGGVDLKA